MITINKNIQIEILNQTIKHNLVDKTTFYIDFIHKKENANKNKYLYITIIIIMLLLISISFAVVKTLIKLNKEIESEILIIKFNYIKPHYTTSSTIMTDE